MGFKKADKIWMNGEFVNWDDAKIHVLSHVVHYGSSVFEGIRCYNTKHGPAVFRLPEHTRRLFNSAKIYRMDIPYTQDEINRAVIETIKVNNLKECYIRPLVYRGYESLGVNPFNCPVDVAIAVWEWGRYLGPEALEQGVDVMVSSWARMAPNTFPAMAKAGANYMNSQLIKMEAIKNGYTEGIALDVTGYVSEGSGENLFVVRDGVLYTPPLGASVLAGITRDSVITIATELGYRVVEQIIPREMLYIADELFFTGSAAEITPIRSVDKITVGKGGRGPITEKLQEHLFDILKGEVEDKHNWLTRVE
ncbi:branched-chain amino acid transaminase [bacterium]|nr:branched-chain amino acid transaminase [bacterium]